MKKKNKLDSVKSFNELLNKKYGRAGSKIREEFEIASNNFMIGELLKMERKKANLTQEDVAEKIGTKKSYISRIERGQSDIQISTYYKLIEFGLGKQLNISIL